MFLPVIDQQALNRKGREERKGKNKKT